MFNDFMTPEILTTFVGLVLATNLIVQFTKSVVKKQFGSSFVRIYAFIIAFILTYFFSRMGEGFQGVIMTIINAIIITMASLGGYEVVSDPMAQKKR